METYNITIHFKPMADEGSVIQFFAYFDEPMTDLAICETLFHQSNNYEGELYNRIQAKHLVKYGEMVRSLSMFDEVTIEGRSYKCASFGWDKVGA